MGWRALQATAHRVKPPAHVQLPLWAAVSSRPARVARRAHGWGGRPPHRPPQQSCRTPPSTRLCCAAAERARSRPKRHALCPSCFFLPPQFPRGGTLPPSGWCRPWACPRRGPLERGAVPAAAVAAVTTGCVTGGNRLSLHRAPPPRASLLPTPCLQGRGCEGGSPRRQPQSHCHFPPPPPPTSAPPPFRASTVGTSATPNGQVEAERTIRQKVCQGAAGGGCMRPPPLPL